MQTSCWLTIFLLIRSPDRCFSPNTGLQREWGPPPGDLSSCYRNSRCINAGTVLRNLWGKCHNWPKWCHCVSPIPSTQTVSVPVQMKDTGQQSPAQLTAFDFNKRLNKCERNVAYSEIKYLWWSDSVITFLVTEKGETDKCTDFISWLSKVQYRQKTFIHLVDVFCFCCLYIWNNGQNSLGFFNNKWQTDMS